MSRKSKPNKPARFPDNEEAKSSESHSSHEYHNAGSSFGPGYGTGLGLEQADGFGSGTQIEAGYGGPQYAGGSNYPAGGNPYGRPQQTGFNASPGSGSQYSAADGQSPSPAGNVPKGKNKKWKKRK
jgi:hypothetical protein